MFQCIDLSSIGPLCIRFTPWPYLLIYKLHACDALELLFKELTVPRQPDYQTQKMVSYMTAAQGPATRGLDDGILKYVLLVCSIFFPGITQIIYGILYDFSIPYIVIGVVILLLSPLLLGWIWSIVWGVNALRGGLEDKDVNDTPEVSAPQETA